MFRTIHIKLVGIFILLIVSLMTVVGSFMITRVVQFYLDEFAEAMTQVFNNDTEFFNALRTAAASGDVSNIKEILNAYSGKLGIDVSQRQRHYYILDAENGMYLAGSDDERGAALDIYTPNIIKALSGEVGFQRQFSGSYMDCAVPIESADGAFSYIVYIRDEKRALTEQTSQMFIIIIEALMIGLIISVLLAFALSKTMTTPIENLTKSAQMLATGQLSQRLDVHSADEIGVLTKTFNDMAQILRTTMDAIGNERDKLGTLFLHMNDGVAAFSKSGLLLHMNPAAEDMLGMSFADTLTFDIIFKDIAENLSDGSFVVKAVEKNGRKLDMSFTTFGTPGTEGGIMVLIYDVTEQAMLDKMRREFISSVSHELRTPLTNVRSYAETLTTPEGLDAEIISKFSQVIVGEADRMTRIVSDLFTLSRFDYGKMDWHFTVFPASELLKGAFEAMRFEALHRGQKLSIDIPLSLPEMNADRERLEQVLVNILSNAIKYTPECGEIEMKARIDEGKLEIAVSDSGIGIPTEDIERVFERFYRVDKARSRASGGTGLGLSIARQIVEHHGGTISISSEVGKGTAVIVRLPVG